MKIEKIEGNRERQILTAMIVDQVVLGRIAAKWGERMFKSPWADIVGKWCVTYFNRYNQPPSSNVQGLFETWAKGARDKDTVQLVERFLAGLSGEYEELAKDLNSDYVVDLAAKHFTSIKLLRAVEEVTADLEDGKVDEAVARLTNFNRVDMGVGAVLKFTKDANAMREAFEMDEEDLIKYPGALGHFFKGQLGRDCFVSFIAPEKRGKSFWLIDMGWRAMLQRRRVAWFSAGDMSLRQVQRRMAARAAQHPVRAKSWPVTVQYPVKMRRVDGIEIKAVPRTFQEKLEWGQAWRAAKEISEYKLREKEAYLRIVAHPNSTLSVKGIDAQLEAWEREGWVADVVIVDYADILDEAASAPGQREKRLQVDASWRAQRALSQKWHILYVTATQSDAEGTNQSILGPGNFSESKTKLAHVTGLAGINQDSDEKGIGAFRLNWVVLREGEYSVGQTVCTAGCLALGNPAVLSCF